LKSQPFLPGVSIMAPRWLLALVALGLLAACRLDIVLTPG
jgi:hypothetical protein